MSRLDPHALAVRRQVRCPWDVGPAPHVLTFVAASWGPAVWGVRQTEIFRCATCPRVLVIVDGAITGRRPAIVDVLGLAPPRDGGT